MLFHNAIMEAAGSKDRSTNVSSTGQFRFSENYKPTNNNLQTSSNTSKANQDNSPRINRGTRYDNQRAVNVVGARENVGTPVVQKSGIQCYNCKEYCWGSVRIQNKAWIGKMILMMESEDQELEHIICLMAQILGGYLQIMLTILGPLFD
ncbi:hypothetical protein Tco_0247009 [Tanacetum coccineum]